MDEVKELVKGISGGRASQAEETARAKPGVRLSWMCVRSRREGIRVLRGEPLGYDIRERWRDK